MPSPVRGKCFCGASLIDPTGGYGSGYCVPYPPDEGLSFEGCKQGDDDTFGWLHRETNTTRKKHHTCKFYCTCLVRRKKGKAGSVADITCCHPGKGMGLKDGVVIRAPAPPPPPPYTGPPTTSRTYRILTTRTTTGAPFYGPQKVIGSMDLSTVLPFELQMNSFLQDQKVNTGIRDGIALKLGVPRTWVTTALSMPARHIQVDYIIDFPDNVQGNKSAISIYVTIIMSNDDSGKSDWSEYIGMGLSATTELIYKVAVNDVHQPMNVRSGKYGSTSYASMVGRGMVLLKAFLCLMAVLVFSSLLEADGRPCKPFLVA